MGLLLCKYVSFLFVVQHCVDHTPNRCFSRTGFGSDNFDGMLTINNIIDSITSAHTDYLDLIDIEVLYRFCNMRLRETALVFLVRNKLVNRYKFKCHIRDTSYLPVSQFHIHLLRTNFLQDFINSTL